MVVTVKTIIGFEIPEESNLLKAFMAKQNLDEWKIGHTGNMINYQKTDVYMTGAGKDEEG